MRQPNTPGDVDKVLAEIPSLKPFQGTDALDHVGYGESTYGPVTTQLLNPKANAKPQDMAQWGRIARSLAEHGLYVNAHVEMEPAIDAFLMLYEQISKDEPIKGLRWAFSHLDQVTPSQIERMKRLRAVVTTQPASYIWKSGPEALARVGDGEQILPHRALLAAGLPFVLSTDNKPYQMLFAFWAALARTARDTGQVARAAAADSAFDRAESSQNPSRVKMCDGM